MIKADRPREIVGNRIGKKKVEKLFCTHVLQNWRDDVNEKIATSRQHKKVIDINLGLKLPFSFATSRESTLKF